MTRHFYILVFFVMMAPIESIACEKAYGVSYAVKSGLVAVSINGVPVAEVQSDDDISYSGIAQMRFWLKAGENTVEVESRALDQGGKPTGIVEIVEACKGQMIESLGGNDGAIVKIDFVDAKKTSATFNVTDAIQAPYLVAAADGNGGLAEALETLKTAFTNKDIDTIIDLHKPYIELAAMEGVPNLESRMRGMYGQLLQEGELSFSEPVVMSAGFDGKVHIITGTGEDQAPIKLEVKETDGSFSITSGRYWSKIDGKWYVINQ